MNAPSWSDGPPRKILLATDLSARSDRALDRALSLAQRWEAQLFVLHVLADLRQNESNLMGPVPSWKRPSDPLSVARRNIEAELSDVADKATVVVGEGDPVESIVGVAERERCNLIVIGIARNELFGEFSLGRTVDRLIRRSRLPLLIVKKRARRLYHHIVVATDFSESSRHALDAAVSFFPDETLTLFHAYDPPMSRMMADAVAYRQECRKLAEEECEAFLRAAEKLDSARRPHVMIEYGAPNHLLRDYAVDTGVDLMVVGTHGRSAFFDVLIGSVAKRILDDVPCDTLVIREPRAKVA